MTYSPTEQEYTPTSINTVALKIKALPGQVAKLQEWRNSADAVVGSVGPSGEVALPSVAATGAVSGSSVTATGALAGATAAISTADGLTVNSDIVPVRLEISVSCVANAACVDQAFFIANRAYQVMAISEVHAVAGDNGGAVNLQVTKDTSTNAPGAGANLLTNNTDAGFDLKGTANTVQTGTLSGTLGDKQLAIGDRLSLDFAGTVTTLAGLVVTVSLKRL